MSLIELALFLPPLLCCSVLRFALLLSSSCSALFRPSSAVFCSALLCYVALSSALLCPLILRLTPPPIARLCSASVSPASVPRPTQSTNPQTIPRTIHRVPYVRYLKKNKTKKNKVLMPQKLTTPNTQQPPAHPSTHPPTHPPTHQPTYLPYMCYIRKQKSTYNVIVHSSHPLTHSPAHPPTHPPRCPA